MVAIAPNVAEAAFTADCKDISRDSSVYMHASCKNDQGVFRPTGINLNDYIGRDQTGHLVWQQGGRFSIHCRSRRRIYDSARNHTLQRARCTIPNSNNHQTSDLDLDERIYVNPHGHLFFQ
jgi:CVNH domain